jgi:tetratricopeptide (TPR) repeat protein
VALWPARYSVGSDPRDAMAHAQLGWALSNLQDFGPSEAEYETALRLNPGDAEVLGMYSLVAPSFDHPERGAEAADHAIRLNPNYQVWQAWSFSYAYFCARRFEDTLRVLERLPKDDYGPWSWFQRAASYAALGQSAKARAAVSDALAHVPDFTIEGYMGDLGTTDADRKCLIEPARAAGLPVCASAETLAKNPKLVRMPECLPK